MLAGSLGRWLQEIADDDCCCQEVYGSTFGRYVVKDATSAYICKAMTATPVDTMLNRI